MAQLLISQEKINSLTAGLFAIGVGILFYLDVVDLWAGLALVLGLSLIVRSLLMNRIVDLFVALIVFGGSWFTLFYEVRSKLFVSILLFAGAIYVIVSQIIYFVIRHRRRPLQHVRKGEHVDAPDVQGEEEEESSPYSVTEWQDRQF